MKPRRNKAPSDSASKQQKRHWNQSHNRLISIFISTDLNTHLLWKKNSKGELFLSDFPEYLKPEFSFQNPMGLAHIFSKAGGCSGLQKSWKERREIWWERGRSTRVVESSNVFFFNIYFKYLPLRMQDSFIVGYLYQARVTLL